MHTYTLDLEVKVFKVAQHVKAIVCLKDVFVSVEDFLKQDISFYISKNYISFILFDWVVVYIRIILIQVGFTTRRIIFFPIPIPIKF